MNMTLDGFCDHQAMIANDEMHNHYTEMSSSVDTILYGKITYQLMEGYWPEVVKNPSGNKAVDKFAKFIDKISKIVFSSTLKSVKWKNSRITTKSLKKEITELKQQPGKDILIGSPSLIVAATNLGLIDEYQLCVQPILEGKGLSLFKNIQNRVNLKLVKTKTFDFGGITLYYVPSGR